MVAKTGDAYLQALTLSYAGLATVEHGQPQDGLTMLQFGQAKAWDIATDDERSRATGRRTRAVVVEVI